LHYDKNHSGAIEPSDMELSADLFSRLDVSKQHKIAPRDLTSAIDQMEKTIDSYNSKSADAQRELRRCEEELQRVISADAEVAMTAEELEDKQKKLQQRRLKAEEIEVEIKKKQEHLAHLTREKAREESMLNETVGIFRRGFVESLFLKLGGKGAPTAEHTRRYEMMSEELERIERQLRSLQLEAESRSSPKPVMGSRLSSGSSGPSVTITSTTITSSPQLAQGQGLPPLKKTEQPSTQPSHGHKYEASSKDPQEPLPEGTHEREAESGVGYTAATGSGERAPDPESPITRNGRPPRPPPPICREGDLYAYESAPEFHEAPPEATQLSMTACCEQGILAP